jgi:hypothetical protein
MRIHESIISTFFEASSHGLREQEASNVLPKWLRGEGFFSSQKKAYTPSGWRRLINSFKNLQRKYSLYKTFKKWAPSVLGAGAIATLAAHFRKPATEALGKLFNRPAEEIAPTFDAVQTQVANLNSNSEKSGIAGFFGRMANKVVITLTCLGAGLGALYLLRNKISDIVMKQSRKVSRNFTDVVSERFSELLDDPNSPISRAIAGVGQKYGPEMAEWAGHVFQFQLTKPSTVARLKEATGNILPNKKDVLESTKWTKAFSEYTGLGNWLNPNTTPIETLDVIHKFHATLEKPVTVDKDELEKKSLKFLSEHASLVKQGADPVTKQSILAHYKVSNENFTKKLATEVVLNAQGEHAAELKTWLSGEHTTWFKENIVDRLDKIQAPQKGWTEEAKNALIKAKSDFSKETNDKKHTLLHDLSRSLPHGDTNKTEIADLKSKINKNPYGPLITTFEKAEAAKPVTTS